MNRQAPSNYDLVVGHANVETGHDRDYVVQDYEKFLGCDVVALNEVYSANYWRYLRSVFKRKRWAKYPRFGKKGAADPILWDKRKFKVICKHTVYLHGGISGLLSPRYINRVFLQDNASGEIFGVRNMHYVSKAFNGKNDKHEQERRRLWYEGYENDKNDLRKVTKNYPVVTVGDYNRPDWEPMEKTSEVFASRGLDKVYSTPLRSWRKAQLMRVDLNSNHPGHILFLKD